MVNGYGDWVLTTVRVALGVVLFAHGAILMSHGKVGFFMNWSGNQRGEGFEYHLVVIALAVVVMVKGAGAFSFDSALSHHDVTIAKSIESAFGIGSEK